MIGNKQAEPSDFASGDDFYYVTQRATIEHYTYVCASPKDKRYHILMDENNKIRMTYYVNFETMLINCVRTYKEALSVSIKFLENEIYRRKAELKKIEHEHLQNTKI